MDIEINSTHFYSTLKKSYFTKNNSLILNVILSRKTIAFLHIAKYLIKYIGLQKGNFLLQPILIFQVKILPYFFKYPNRITVDPEILFHPITISSKLLMHISNFLLRPIFLPTFTDDAVPISTGIDLLIRDCSIPDGL